MQNKQVLEEFVIVKNVISVVDTLIHKITNGECEGFNFPSINSGEFQPFPVVYVEVSA